MQCPPSKFRSIDGKTKSFSRAFAFYCPVVSDWILFFPFVQLNSTRIGETSRQDKKLPKSAEGMPFVEHENKTSDSHETH